jgi:hypothetical protein
MSAPNAAGTKTSLRHQKVNETLYFDSGGFEGRSVGLPSNER